MPGLRAKKSLLTVFFILIMIFGNFAQMKDVTPNDLNLQSTQASWSPGNDEIPTTTIINTITNTTEINVIDKSNNTTSSINNTFNNNNNMSSNNNSYNNNNNNTIDAFNNNNTYNKNNTLNNNNTYDKNNTLNNNNNNTYDNKNNTLNNNNTYDKNNTLNNNNNNNTYDKNNTLNNNNNNNTYDNKNNTLNNNNNTYDKNNTLNNNNNNTYDNKNNTYNSNYDVTNNNFYNNSGKNNASLPSNNSTETINNTLGSTASEQVNISKSLKNISNPSQKNSTNVEGTNPSQIGAKSSLSPLSQYLVNLLNKTMLDYILHKNQTTATKVSPQDLKSWLKNSNQTDTQPLVSNSSTTPSSLPVEHCSILPNFVKICHLPIEYQDGEDSMTTFEDLEDALSHSYIQYWLSSCQLGKWCLSQVFDSMLRDSLNISEKFCSKIFLSCLRTTTDNYTSCANYEKYKILRDSLELICAYKTVESEQNNLQTCGFHAMKLISTILSDFKRKLSPRTNEENFCETQKGFMMTSFNCLLKQCSPTFQDILLKLETWKWFTENRTLATTCQTYYECIFTSTTTSLQSSFSFTRPFYRTGESSTRTRWNFVKTTTGTEFKGDNQQNVDASKIGVEEEEMDEKYHFYKKNNEENSHMVASLSAMMAILMIGMSVVMIVCWRHFKRNGAHKRMGYSKLKTGEC